MRILDKKQPAFVTLSQTGEPIMVHRFTRWHEYETFGGVGTTKGSTHYYLENGETVIRKSPTEFECPSSGLLLRSEEPIDED